MKLLPSSTALALIPFLSLSSRCLSAPVLEESNTNQLLLHLQEETDSSSEPFAFASLFENPTAYQEPSDHGEQTSIPTRYHTTLLARRLLHLSTHADLITTFPSSSNLTARTPPSVANTPIGLPEYIATCEETALASRHSGDPTILSLKVSTATRNAQAGSNASLSISWWDEFVHLTGPDTDTDTDTDTHVRKPYSPANLPRLSLTGYLEEIPLSSSSRKAIEACFLRKHKDSIMWLPGSKWAAHEGFWTRLVVQEAYWIGGFGDRNYIGWLDPEEWRGVRRAEWEGLRLPGEKE